MGFEILPNKHIVCVGNVISGGSSGFVDFWIQDINSIAFVLAWELGN